MGLRSLWEVRPMATTMQGATLVLSTAVVGYVTDQPHLYLSAVLTLLLKVLLISLTEVQRMIQ